MNVHSWSPVPNMVNSSWRGALGLEGPHSPCSSWGDAVIDPSPPPVRSPSYSQSVPWGLGPMTPLPFQGTGEEMLLL